MRANKQAKTGGAGAPPLGGAAAGSPGLLRAEPAGSPRPHASPRGRRRAGAHQGGGGPTPSLPPSKRASASAFRFTRRRRRRASEPAAYPQCWGAAAAACGSSMSWCVFLLALAGSPSLALALLALACLGSHFSSLLFSSRVWVSSVFWLSLSRCFAVLALLRFLFLFFFTSFPAPEAGIIPSTRGKIGMLMLPYVLATSFHLWCYSP